MRNHPIEHYYQTLRDSAPWLSRAARPPEGHQIGARKRRAPENTTLSQPYRPAASQPTGWIAKKGSQLASFLESNPGPTPAGKTLPHSYPETRFRRGRARAMVYIVIPFILDVSLVDAPAGVTQEEGQTGFLRLPFCGACLNFSREKNSAIPFPRRPWSRSLSAGDSNSHPGIRRFSKLQPVAFFVDVASIFCCPVDHVP